MERNHEYQRRLAQSLIRGFGVEAALDFALENRWDGVLAHIVADAGAAETPHPVSS